MTLETKNYKQEVRERFAKDFGWVFGSETADDSDLSDVFEFLDTLIDEVREETARDIMRLIQKHYTTDRATNAGLAIAREKIRNSFLRSTPTPLEQ